MDTGKKVNLLLITIGFLSAIVIAFALDKYRQNTDYTPVDNTDYTEQIRLLSDTIQGLKKDIEFYKSEIERIDLERSKIKKELTKIIRDNDETDTKLANGSVDDNIEFLTRFLSKGTYYWERHDSCGNKTTDDSPK